MYKVKYFNKYTYIVQLVYRVTILQLKSNSCRTDIIFYLRIFPRFNRTPIKSRAPKAKQTPPTMAPTLFFSASEATSENCQVENKLKGNLTPHLVFHFDNVKSQVTLCDIFYVCLFCSERHKSLSKTHDNRIIQSSTRDVWLCLLFHWRSCAGIMFHCSLLVFSHCLK